jgi:hypothetical protein
MAWGLGPGRWEPLIKQARGVGVTTRELRVLGERLRDEEDLGRQPPRQCLAEKDLPLAPPLREKQ